MRIIINIWEGVTEERAIDAVWHVIAQGRISHANDKDHYCWHTAFNDGVHVSVKPKYGTDSDIFTVYKSKSIVSAL